MKGGDEMDDKRKAALLLVGLVHDTVKDAGSQGIPSGHLYSMLMGHISLDTYQTLVDLLIKAGKITESGHLLKATQV